VIPQTAVLGAILLTRYFGGAVVSHLRVGDQFVGPIIFGVLLWAGTVPARQAAARADSFAKLRFVLQQTTFLFLKRVAETQPNTNPNPEVI
jgi:hypothetical protein